MRHHIQISLDQQLDNRLEQEARRRGTSKAALIRDLVAREYPSATATPNVDGLALLDGLFDSGESNTDIDDVVYRSRR
jgi:hypothetical protein